MNPLGDPQAEVSSGCYWDKLNDDTAYGLPKQVATVNVGGAAGAIPDV